MERSVQRGAETAIRSNGRSYSTVVLVVGKCRDELLL